MRAEVTREVTQVAVVKPNRQEMFMAWGILLILVGGLAFTQARYRSGCGDLYPAIGDDGQVILRRGN